MKKQKIEFYSTIPGVADVYPITPAKEFSPRWMKACKADYIKNKSFKRPSHLQQCPGIFDLFKHGFIIPLWHDSLIRTERDKEGFAYVHPSEVLSDMREGDPVASHSHSITKWLPKRPQSIAPIMKFNTPWHVIAPKGVKFLMTAVAYTDTYEFEACTGILDPSVSTELNVQGYWNKHNGETMLRAGQPLAHLIPLTENEYDYEVRDANEHDLAWSKKRTYFHIHSFNLNKGLFKDMYHKHFRRT
jgi:hypothetical protein|tara:strand:- start:10811 stop:11545 length:735 start_codon:yes stop_codon:yes gene_type:complete